MPPAHPKNKHSGSIMIMVAIMLPIILGILSLAVDLGNVFLVRSQMQNAADAASLAAAGRLRSGTTAAQIAIAKTAAVNIANLNGFPVGATTTIAVAIPPGPSPDGSTATYAANPLYARVTITQTMRSFLGGMIGLLNILQTKQAVAGSSPSLPCLITSLSGDKSILVKNESRLSAANCGIQSNGKIQTQDHGTINVSAIDLRSGSSNLNDTRITPSMATITGITYTDPFNAIPSPSGSMSSGSSAKANGVTTYSPGKYTEIKIEKGTVVFSPGVYWITGDMKISEASVTGSDVFFYSSSGRIELKSDASIVLKAPRSGTYTGLLFRQNGNETSFVSGNLQGNLDFPNAFLHLAAATNLMMNTGTIFANKLELADNTQVTMTNIYGSGSSTTTNVTAIHE